jgi:hypothetical protein
MLPYSFADMLDALPQIMLLAQIVMNFVLAWAFGAIAFRGLKKDLRFYIRIPALLVIGLLCLLAGVIIREFISFNNTIFRILQIDLFISGLIVSMIIATSLYLITRKFAENKDKKISQLEERIKLLENILAKEKVQPIKENDAKKMAEALVKGFTVKEANLKLPVWEILLEKGSKKAKIILGAYTGDVRKIDYVGRKDVSTIAGILIIVFIAIFTLVNFKGFPSFTETIAPLFGMNETQFNEFFGPKQMPEGCVRILSILAKQGVKVIGSEQNLYKNEDVSKMLEANTGKRVLLMYNTTYEGKNYVISVLLPKDYEVFSEEEIKRYAEICVSTDEVLCECIKIEELNRFTGSFVADIPFKPFEKK